MGRLSAGAFMSGDAPSSSHLTLLDMPPRLAEALTKSVMVV